MFSVNPSVLDESAEEIEQIIDKLSHCCEDIDDVRNKLQSVLDYDGKDSWNNEILSVENVISDSMNMMKQFETVLGNASLRYRDTEKKNIDKANSVSYIKPAFKCGLVSLDDVSDMLNNW